MNAFTYVGIVEHGRLRLLLAEDGRTGLFQLSASEATAAPRVVELSRQEGHVLMVRGVSRDEWIHSASIVEQASSLLAIVAQAALGHTVQFPQG